ncbi:hypothetical protein H0264_14565 [Nocardia huaxiensis]|uniref:Uncharacterized protein n=1 Tax=Nocardia huaxiensis TaxID=2755382 RepID=A0A7D6VEA6_9NOCA|nr:hypothetical protein [Nocardia huaxiensis]QLY33291.1 hypothetical protein H0264_14565 [Nocardia huaxiensis]
MSRRHQADPINGVEVVQRHWPLDGPYTAESIVAATDAIGELHRYLAHATIGSARNALPNAPGAYPLFGNLAYSAHIHGEVLRNLSRWAGDLAGDSSLRHDEYRGPDQTPARTAAQDAAGELRRAAGSSEAVGNAVSNAHGAIGHLYHELDRGLDR